MSLYSELLPEELEDLWQKGAPAIIPWGALEWHGRHLPLGLDGIVAEWFGSQLADRESGVLLPTVWLPITTLPHPLSLQIATKTFRLLLDDLISGLIRAGATTIVLVSGHYAQAHQIEMAEGALRAMEDYPGIRLFTGTPLEVLNRPELLDHAARYEASQLAHIRPDLVHLENVPPLHTPIHDSAILGENPRLGSADEGRDLLEQALDGWRAWLAEATPTTLTHTYKQVFDRYGPYVEEFYRGSWEDAILAWWQSKKA